MPSNTPQAEAHRARQSLRPYQWIAEDADGNPLRNSVTFVHGLPCTNRREKRVALGTAKKFGCDERGKSHGAKCPMFKLQKIVEATQATEKAIGQAQKAIDALDALKAASAEPAANDAPASAAEKIIGNMFDGIASDTVPWDPPQHTMEESLASLPDVAALPEPTVGFSRELFEALTPPSWRSA